MSKLLSATSNRGRVVLTVADVLHVRGNDANPHLWYDIPRIADVAQAIDRALAAADPDRQTTFEQNLAAFDASLEPLLDTIDEIKREVSRRAGRVHRRVPGYLLAACGLTVKTPTGFRAGDRRRQRTERAATRRR